MTGEKEGEAHAKEQRKDGIELAIDKSIQEEAEEPVNSYSRHSGLSIGIEKSPQTELREVSQHNA